MEIKNLSYIYKGTDAKALDDITLTIEKESISCIIGKNGSGKTTLLELISNLRIPTDGTITIGKFELKENIIGKEYWFEVAYNENIEEILDETIKEKFTLALKLFNYNSSKIKERIISSLKMVELDESYLNKKMSNLTLGEKNRIKIAYALLLNPKILLLDNPTIGIDEQGKKLLIKIIKLMKRRYNKTIIIASNDIEFIHKIADRIIVLNDGKIILDGDKYEVFKQEDKLKKIGINSPKIIHFSNIVLKKKNIKIGYRDEINDLIKDIYRYAK